MSEIKTIMELSVNTLAQQQHLALKKHVLKILDEVKQHISNENYEKVGDYLSFSPSGDGYGCDNYYIDFGWGEEELDIQEVCSKLSQLKPTSGGKWYER